MMIYTLQSNTQPVTLTALILDTALQKVSTVVVEVMLVVLAV